MRELRRPLILFLRLFLGAVFLYAALGKWQSPQAFSEDMANYRLLPAALVPVLSITLLGLETVIGALLITGLWAYEAALLSTLLLGLFTAAVASALYRGLKIDCGCFGAGESPATWMSLLRDGAFLVISGILTLLLRPRSCVAVDHS